MYLYPYKRFSLSKDKRLFNASEPWRTCGVYNVETYNYEQASIAAADNAARVSVMLGEVCKGINLICLDLDDCFEPSGEMEGLTQDFLSEFDNSEWEVSSSGTGIHIYLLTKKDFKTFIVKDIQGCKSFECYTNKRHIVTTTFDFENTNLVVGKHDDFLEALYLEVEELRAKKMEHSQMYYDVQNVFDGKKIETKEELRGIYLGRTPVTDMFTLRGLGFKDPAIIEVIDQCPDAVDQSAWDAKLIRKLMYYTLSFESAWDMAMKTNYYKAKDKKHKDKFNNPTYKERTRAFIERGGGTYA